MTAGTKGYVSLSFRHIIWALQEGMCCRAICSAVPPSIPRSGYF